MIGILNRLYRRNRRILMVIFLIMMIFFTLNNLETTRFPDLLDPSSNSIATKSKQDDPEEYQDQLRKLNKQKFGGGTQQLSHSDIDVNIRTTNEYLMSHLSLSQVDLNKLELATKNPFPFDSARLATIHSSLKDIFQVYKDSAPTIDSLGRYKHSQRIYHAGYDTKVDPNAPVFTEDYLREFLDLNDEELQAMKSSHENVVRNLPENFSEGAFKGNGIVYVGGGNFNWLVMLSIKTLRYLGSELPVEVIIPKVEEYEIDLCGRVFPALGAKCVLLPQVLGAEVVKNFKFFGYQYKALALLASSFENVLLLDSDNVPAAKPDYLFDSEPYKSKGLISWPDFWKRATSPYFYDIAGITVSQRRTRYGYHNYGVYEAGIINENEQDPSQIPLHDREGTIPDPTTESGQLMISKKFHAKTLLLSLYYNLYGPSHYYPLFSQGSDGEGDKETFLAAAVVLDKPFYQVNKFLNAFGHYDEDRTFIGCGMGQYDPVEDYSILSNNLDLLKERPEKNFMSFQDANDAGIPLQQNTPRILFIHANFPKLNPAELKKKGILFKKNGDRIRLYGEGMPKRVGYDFELVQWTSMYSLVCELEIKVDAFNSISRNDLCDEISAQLAFLKNSINSLDI
ncbi:alpha-1,2-mannosyltransferase [Saccharomycopsis crataegensis]|uniref:Alpha-1,2-mannosyltransferase n=1 Tax=Saccharomycopsis crataegensis TaxID=43959 RepID=A0AAV5QU38_9ASCO|nr:alpha-1,2-mannosyltransferase [Saccharomycopsis crataegensis]